MGDSAKTRVALVAAVAVALAASVLVLRDALGNRAELAALRSNELVLLDSIGRYVVSDSLNAVRVRSLTYSLDDYKELYRKEYAEVERLKADRKGLRSVIELQQRAIARITAALSDSIVRDTVWGVLDTVRCFDHHSEWVDVSGCVDGDSVSVSVASRDRILIVESVERKRFIGIRLPVWLFGYRCRMLDAVSSNPRTVITGVEYKTITR